MAHGGTSFLTSFRLQVSQVASSVNFLLLSARPIENVAQWVDLLYFLSQFKSNKYETQKGTQTRDPSHTTGDY